MQGAWPYASVTNQPVWAQGPIFVYSTLCLDEDDYMRPRPRRQTFITYATFFYRRADHVPITSEPGRGARRLRSEQLSTTAHVSSPSHPPYILNTTTWTPFERSIQVDHTDHDWFSKTQSPHGIFSLGGRVPFQCEKNSLFLNKTTFRRPGISAFFSPRSY